MNWKNFFDKLALLNLWNSISFLLLGFTEKNSIYILLSIMFFIFGINVLIEEIRK